MSGKKKKMAWLEKTIDELNAGLFERRKIIAIALLAVLSGQSVFLYGPPGTAKSLISRRISCVFRDSSYFEYLMQRFSTPEEIFGPVNIAELKKNNYVRDTENYLPTADIAFLDEIWKSSPAILNTLLTIINERKFKNGKTVENVPLKALIAASNEFPPDNSGLDALYDRFITRLYVGPLNDEDDFVNMISNNRVDSFVKISSPLTKEMWAEMMDQAHDIKVDGAAMSAIKMIRKGIDDANSQPNSTKIYVSDRRWQKAVYLLKMAALITGRSAVGLEDIMILRDVLWSSEGNRDRISEIIYDSISRSYVYSNDDYEEWKRSYEELKAETGKIFNKRKEVAYTKFTYFPHTYDCYVGQGYMSHYGNMRTTVCYYFPVVDVKAGHGTAYTNYNGVNYHRFLVTHKSKDGEVTINVNNQIVTVQTKEPAKVKSHIKDAYVRDLTKAIDDIDRMIKSATDDISKGKGVTITPFMSDGDADVIKEKMKSSVDEMKNEMKGAKSLLSIVKSYDTE